MRYVAGPTYFLCLFLLFRFIITNCARANIQFCVLFIYRQHCCTLPMLSDLDDECDGPLANLSIDSALRQYADDMAQTVFHACMNDQDPTQSLKRLRRTTVDSDSLRADLRSLQSSLKRQRSEIESLTRSRNLGSLRITSSCYQGSSRSASYNRTGRSQPSLKHKRTSGSLRSLASISGKRHELFGFRRKMRHWWYKT